MVLASCGNLSATSTAAGPAFEGMNITCGMRAGEAAIEFFELRNRGVLTLRLSVKRKRREFAEAGFWIWLVSLRPMELLKRTANLLTRKAKTFCIRNWRKDL